MLTETTMYWITRIDYLLNTVNGICMLGTLVSLIAGISLAICLIVKAVCAADDEDYIIASKISSIARRLLIAAAAVATLAQAAWVFIPSTKDYIAIKVVPAIVNNEKLQNISTEFVDVAEQWLKDMKSGNRKGK